MNKPLVTLRIPAMLDEAIDNAPDLDTSSILPLVKIDLPADAGTLTIYADHDTDNTGVNERATMLSSFSPLAAAEGIVISGGVFLVCPDDLAWMLLDHDQKMQGELTIVKLFRAWVENCGEDLGVSVGQVAHVVYGYLDTLVKEVSGEAEVSRLLDRLGLSPDQVKVFRL